MYVLCTWSIRAYQVRSYWAQLLPTLINTTIQWQRIHQFSTYVVGLPPPSYEARNFPTCRLLYLSIFVQRTPGWSHRAMWCNVGPYVVLPVWRRWRGGGGGTRFKCCQGSTRCRVLWAQPITGQGSLVVQSSPPKLARPEWVSVSQSQHWVWQWNYILKENSLVKYNLIPWHPEHLYHCKKWLQHTRGWQNFNDSQPVTSWVTSFVA